MLRLCGADLTETQWVFKYKLLLGKIILLLQLLIILLIQQYSNKNNKVTSNHAALNIYTSVQNLGFCCADTLSYTCT